MTRAPAAPSVRADERRQDLAALSMRAQRANTPTHFVLVGLLAVAAALLYVVVAWRAYAAEAGQRDLQRTTAANVAATAGRLKALIAAESDNGQGPGLAEGGQRIYGRIEQAGVEAGLKDRVPVPVATRSDRVQGTDINRVVRDYDIRDPNLGAIVDWIVRAGQAVPGLEVYSITVKPEAQAWYVRVRFTRHERAEGS